MGYETSLRRGNVEPSGGGFFAEKYGEGGAGTSFHCPFCFPFRFPFKKGGGEVLGEGFAGVESENPSRRAPSRGYRA